MPTVFSLKNATASKDLVEILDRCITLWSSVTAGPDTVVHVFMETSHPAAIQVVAESVPPEQRGFSTFGSENNRTAAEVLASIAQTGATWRGSFAADLAPELLTPLLQRLRGLRADPLRRTSLSVVARSIHWNIHYPEFTGGFSFVDAKVFQRKSRFSFEALCEIPQITTPIRRREAFNSIQTATGLDFRAGRRTDSSPGGEWTAQQRANACIAFDEAVERVSLSLIAERFDWRTLAGVFPHHQGVQQRFQTLGTGGDFRWEKHLKAFVREVFPTFRARSGVVPDAHVFVEPTEESWSCAIVFDRHPGRRIGRVFKVRCGVIYTDAKTIRFKRTAPVLRCSGGAYQQHHDECPEFSFNTEAELFAIFETLGPFLLNYVARFKTELRSFLLEGVEEVSRVPPDKREVTARQADELAKQHLTRAGIAFAGLTSISFVGAADTFEYRNDAAAVFPSNGRSDLLHYWELRYTIPGRFATVAVSVPYAGSIRHVLRENSFAELNPHLRPQTLPTNWCDSDEAARQIHARRDELASRYPAMSHVVGALQLTTEDASPVWAAQIEFSGGDGAERGWVLITHTIDAITAKPIGTKFDERFPDRAITNNVFTERPNSHQE